MAEQQTTLQQIGLTRGKAMLIGVLAVALLGVVYRQYAAWNASSTAIETTGRRPILPRTGPAAVTPTAAADDRADGSMQGALAEFDQARWRPPDLEGVIAYDPFALPSSFPQPLRAVLDPTLTAEGGDGSEAALNAQRLAEAVEQMQRQLEELQQRGVQVIVNLRDEYVALVGDRTLYVGDVINGFTVTAIEPDGVRVEWEGVQ